MEHISKENIHNRTESIDGVMTNSKVLEGLKDVPLLLKQVMARLAEEDRKREQAQHYWQQRQAVSAAESAKRAAFAL